MALSLNTIAPAKGARTKTFRIGRGNASGRGTTSGKGTKGQRARSGGRNRLKLIGLKQMLLAFPKLRGFQSRFPKATAVTLQRVLKAFSAGEKIDVKSLKAKDLIPTVSEKAKIVGTGTVDKALVLSNVLVSASVKAAIEKAGGSVSFTKRTKK